MNKWIAGFLAALILISAPVRALADCDFSQGIEKMQDGRFAYSSECHKKVGKMVQDLNDRTEEVAKLNKTIELKDLTIKMHEQRADLWMGTSLKLEDRVNSMEALKSSNQWLFFGLGVITTGLAVWGAGNLVRR